MLLLVFRDHMLGDQFRLETLYGIWIDEDRLGVVLRFVAFAARLPEDNKPPVCPRP
ncbi:MAG TPA: hypothetical protein VJX48_01875 [Xanthobacteraceae bacterium]|nr:hypothetical protein [Xanthobacteraceae bacterium]